MSIKIYDFTETELRVVATALKERNKEDVEMQIKQINKKINKKINKDNNEKVHCPVIFWRHQGASLSVSKMVEMRFSPRYFSTPGEQFRCTEDKYAEAGDCVFAGLMMQGEHETRKAGTSSSRPAAMFLPERYHN
jgi:hypothetical protein